MVNSINTNIGATVSLESLNRTTSSLDKVQKQISTGYKVADATDNGAAFAVAQGLRSKLSADQAVNSRLGMAQGLLSVTQNSLQRISDTAAQLRQVFTKLGDDGLSTQERTIYTKSKTALIADMTKYIGQASFNGKNLLNTTTSVNTISDASGGFITLTAANLTTAVTTLNAAVSTTGALVRTNVLKATTGAMDVFEAKVNAQLTAIGTKTRSVTKQNNFITVLGNTLNDSIGQIVDADLGKASVKEQSLQIQQQLGTQSLSIANEAPSALLALFK